MQYSVLEVNATINVQSEDEFLKITSMFYTQTTCVSLYKDTELETGTVYKM